MLVACAVREVVPNARVFLTGGAAEGRLTVSSDIDVVVVLQHEPTFEEAAEIRAKILEEAEKLGLPIFAPVELHIVGNASLRRYRTLEPVECTQCD